MWQLFWFCYAAEPATVMANWKAPPNRVLATKGHRSLWVCGSNVTCHNNVQKPAVVGLPVCRWRTSSTMCPPGGKLWRAPVMSTPGLWRWSAGLSLWFHPLCVSQLHVCHTYPLKWFFEGTPYTTQGKVSLSKRWDVVILITHLR